MHVHASRTLRPWLQHPLHGAPAALGRGPCEGAWCGVCGGSGVCVCVDVGGGGVVCVRDVVWCV